MLVNKKNLSLLAATAKDSNFALTSVKLDPETKQMVASNGHSLYFSDLPQLESENFPDTGTQEAVISKECILIPGEALVKAAKNIPAKTSLEILENIQILTDEIQHHLITTDLEYTQDIKVRHSKDTRKNKDGEEIGTNEYLPDYKQIEEQVKRQEIKATTCISVVELEILLKIAKGHKADSIIFELRESNQPITIKGKGISQGGLNGIIMPMRF